MGLSRREFVVLSGLGLLVATTGCSNQQRAERPGPEWPTGRPRPDGAAPPVYTQRQASYVPTPRSQPSYVAPPQQAPALAPVAKQPSQSLSGPLQAIPRSQWAKGAPELDHINPMGGIDRITIHHEGWKKVTVTDMRSTAALIEHDRIAHMGMFHAGDIGYHYIIDRSGRLWEGRSVRYQGAHVRSNNEHNVGVMCLGNFDLQQPTDAQVNSLVDTVAKLARIYRVPVSRIKTHQEINPTACPGRGLQPRVVYLRKSGAFA